MTFCKSWGRLRMAKSRPRSIRLQAFSLGAALLFGVAVQCRAYSVLTHEAVIDAAWDIAIRPLLLRRFPDSTPDQLKEAHSYAYGGAIIADAGYYPFGSKFFSDLVHYVRSADFVEYLIRDSQDLNEYAFALGALAHYVADNDGHRTAVNLAVPLLYPKLRKKFGSVVVYDQDPGAHLKTEFGFDVVQVAKGHYAPQSYHDDIGFHVAGSVLERAFKDTYCLDLKSVFSDFDLAIGTFRFSVSSAIPKMTKVAWSLKRDEIQRDIPDMTKKRFIYNLKRSAYQKEWKKDYKRPALGSRILAFLIQLVPKIGPFSALSFRTPTPETEQLFMASFNLTEEDYKRLLQTQGSEGHVEISNDNLDTGTLTNPGQYALADKTNAELLDRLAKRHFTNTSPELREALLEYFRDPSAPFATKRNKKQWSQIQKEVGELKSTGSGIPAASRDLSQLD
jgi:hypothetical protein